jgi:NAD(P)-dependent dehydrogenase (short-subunit alcohol dehydrogenase family)
MTTAYEAAALAHEPELSGQTVVVVGGSSGMGLETARRARAEGAGVILAGRDPGRLQDAAAAVGARGSAAFDATDPAALGRFFGGLPATIDHVMVTARGPYFAPLAELDHARAVRDFEEHVWLPVTVANHAVGRVRLGGNQILSAKATAAMRRISVRGGRYDLGLGWFRPTSQRNADGLRGV